MRFVNYGLFASDLNKHGFKYAVDHTKRLGFEAVELLSHYQQKCEIINSLDVAKGMKKYLKSRSLSVSCYSMMADLTESDYDLSIAPVLRNIEYAAELEAPYFHHTVIPSINYHAPRMSFDEALKVVFDKAVKIAEHCQKCGMVCLYEPQGFYINGVDGLSRFFEKIKTFCQGVGICADTGNSFFKDTNPEQVFEKFSSEVKHVHVKDYVIEDQGDEKWHQRSISGKYIYDVLPGEGGIDFAKLFAQIKGYTGDVSLEFSCSDEQMTASIEYIKAIITATMMKPSESVKLKSKKASI